MQQSMDHSNLSDPQSNCSVHDSAPLNVKQIIEKCLLSFPHAWVSVIKLQFVVNA